jgi:hypothetical protein
MWNTGHSMSYSPPLLCAREREKRKLRRIIVLGEEESERPAENNG